MAQICKLPEKIKELALKYQKDNQTICKLEVKQCETEHIESAFSWPDTDEGEKFWKVIGQLY